MPIELNLKSTSGEMYKWIVDNDACFINSEGYICAFDVKFTDGSIKHYVALNHDDSHKLNDILSSFAKSMSGTAANAAMRLSKNKPAGIAALGVFAAYAATQLIAYALKDNCGYFDAETGKKVFHGPIRLVKP